ncbi:MAG TPA: helix-turn-helix transcriptional regulator [Hyphomicrobiales bacterium]|nr:helix-turn-helix transcriptional regulator [Hyphomicrobiales bacterium]
MHKKDTYNLAIGLVLQELHEEQKLRREKIAEALEITELAVTRVEHGSEPMSAGSLVLLLELFDVSWDEFIRRVRANLEKAEAQIR